ncbi:MAG: class I SAM-dependent methyltransferase, partial [Syntrophaceae bacterium]|nr:class I SAM-dependent methyltransferase [Syntrophaceae bacterium]
MRLWSLHPRYLDPKGLTALWREGLLARKVLQNLTKGYRKHPQLKRFRSQPDPIAAIDNYLQAVLAEAQRRGYRYDKTKIGRPGSTSAIPVTEGQLHYELAHLKNKLRLRSPDHYRDILPINDPMPHPLFHVVAGDIADWEKSAALVYKKPPNLQQVKWEETFRAEEDLFGDDPSEPARIAAALFKKEGVSKLLELGAGQGRDTLFFAQQGFQVVALDYAATGLKTLAEKAALEGLSPVISTVPHDVRQPLPFADETFDASYSHMLFCMAFTAAELAFISGEVRRVLKPGGLHVYTV